MCIWVGKEVRGLCLKRNDMNNIDMGKNILQKNEHEEMDIKIFIVTHKEYKMIESKPYYRIQVGAMGKMPLGFLRDDEGDNISNLNYYFNEMTAVYWAWKNCYGKYIGFCHYRRYFTSSNWLKRIYTKDKLSLAITQKELEVLTNSYSIILPKKRKYYIETIESHFKHLPYTKNEDLEILREVIYRNFPSCIDSFEKVMNRSWAHMFNMYIMRRDKFTEFAEWAFKVLFQVDKKISMTGRKPIEARMYISEFLLDVWLETKEYKYVEVPVIFIEKNNYLKKACLLIWRKIYGIMSNRI